jgi:hypothetical protein
MKKEPEMGMKRTLTQITYAGVLVFIFGPYGIEKVSASPHQEDIGVCDYMRPNGGDVNYGRNENTRGITTTVDNIEPKGVVIISQDEEKIGVSFDIRVESQPGTISYMAPEWHCGGVGNESDVYVKDYCGRNGTKYQLWHKECTKTVTQTVYRSIEAVLVTLEPDEDTTKLYYGEFQKRISRIYPTYWKDFEINIVFLDFPDISFDFTEIPYLEAMGSVNWNAFDGMPVVMPNFRTRDGFYMLAYDDYSHFCAAANGCNPDRTQGNKPGQKAELTYAYTLSVQNLPIGLPGYWKISVWVVLGPAYYGPSLQRPETLQGGNPSDDLDRMPTEEEVFPYHFESYAIISAPCNPEEEFGCTDKP